MRLKIVFLFIFLSNLLFSQETIDVQRPTLTESYSIIDKGIIQFENGMLYDVDSETNSYSVFTRFGLNEKLELRFSSDLMNPYLNFGIKGVVIRAKENIPGISLILGYDLIRGFQDFRISASNSIGNRLFYTANIGNNFEWYGIGLVGITITDNSAAFVEGSLNESEIFTFNTGAIYIINNEVQVDIHGGVNSFNSETSPYLGGGISFRIK